MARRKICVVTGSRAEYGLLAGLMRRIRADKALKLQLIVTGAHLAREFGLTYRTIESDGFRIDAKVDLRLSNDDPASVCAALGRATAGIGLELSRLKPDLMVVLGDRYEILGAAQAALISRIPVAHISGGETTEGSLDDSIRHAVTKLSQLHFPATREYGRRLVQLGEEPRRVFVVGDPGVENARRAKLLTRAEWSRRTGFALAEENVAVAFHPATAEAASSGAQFHEVLGALRRLPDSATIVLTRSNADVGGREINAAIDRFVAERPSRRAAFASLGSLLFLSLLKNSRVLVGNSSSGIVEAPALKVPTVDVGDRQKGRLCASSVVHAAPRAAAISAAIRKAWALDCARVRHPYGGGDVSAKILRVLKRADLAGLAEKRFHDAPAPRGVGR